MWWPTPAPVRGAFVNVIDTRASNPTERKGRWIATDADGRWEFADLAPGRYAVSVTKSGYLKIEYGQQRPFERGKAARADCRPGVRQGGRDPAAKQRDHRAVFDEFGDPAAAVMRALRHRYVDGRRQLTPLSEGIEVLANGGDITDDLGQFRIYGLAPGDYYVSAAFSPRPRAHRLSAHLLSRHGVAVGGASNHGAARRRSGQHQCQPGHCQFQRRFGPVLNSLNAPVKASLQLSTEDTSVCLSDRPRVLRTERSRFDTCPPGDTGCASMARSRSGTAEFASVPVVVGGEDVAGIVVITFPGATAGGRVVFEDGESRTPASS